jgi:hypothetical protein
LIIAALGFVSSARNIALVSFGISTAGCRHPPQMSTGSGRDQGIAIMQKRGFCFRGTDISVAAGISGITR